jgi:hypothetical protein
MHGGSFDSNSLFVAFHEGPKAINIPLIRSYRRAIMPRLRETANETYVLYDRELTACFRDHAGRQRRITTKETNRKRAQRRGEYEVASRAKRTLKQAQAVLDRLHEELSGERIVRTTLRQAAAGSSPKIMVRGRSFGTI